MSELAELTKIVGRMEKHFKLGGVRQLWSRDDIASYLNQTDIRKDLAHPSFPKPIIRKYEDGTHSHPRWRPEDVIDWAVGHLTNGRPRRSA